MMEFDHILKLSAQKLYEKALQFKESKKDYDNYCIYMTMSANYGYKLAEEDLDNDYTGPKLHTKQNYKDTIKFYEETKDYSYSANYLGYIYNDESNILMRQDNDKAMELYEIAIKKGNKHAIHNLACMYENPQNVSHNFNKARELFEMSVNKGNSYSVTSLAQMYSKGKGVDQDHKKAKELYEMGVIRGNFVAIHNLALMYEKGEGVLTNPDKARELYEMAIEKGDMEEVDQLTRLYRLTDLKNDKEKVISYYTKINKMDRLKEIYNFDDNHMQLIVNNNKKEEKINKLKRKIKELKTHIMASPEGELYFEAKAHYSNVSNKLN